MKKLLLLLLCQTIFFITANAQSSQQVLKWMNTVNAGNRNFYYEIPFEYRSNEIIIKVTIGDGVYDYIFDTGGYNDITDEIQSKNNFPVLGRQTVGSSNGLKAAVNIVKVDSLKIGPLVFRDMAALQMNFAKSPIIKCTINGALIGAAIIKNYTWQIDYPNKKIIITDQLSKLPNLEGAIKVPVTFNTRLMPFVNVKVNGNDEKLMFDLGSSSLFILTQKTAKQYENKGPVIKIEGGSSEGGNGVLKQTMKIIKADSLEIGAIKFKNKPVICLQTASGSLIGNPIIKNFIVTLDFKDSALYFAPIKQAPPERGWASFGFGMKYVDGNIRVTTIYKGIAADNAGLMMNDEIIAIDGQKLSYRDECEAIGPLAAILDSKTEMTLTVLRDGVAKEIKLVKDQVF
jgi:hypothetical protein